MEKPNIALGVASAIGVIFVWSGFFVFSRAGVTSALTPFDLAALRFAVAGLLVLPFVKKWWPANLSWLAVATVALCGPGTVYTIYMYFGLTETSAAYGGVFANGSLPIFSMFLAFAITGMKPSRRQVSAIGIIVFGCIILGWRGLTAGGENTALGIILFLSASYILSVYIFCLGYWKVSPQQALLMVNLPNAIIFIPVWYFLLPSGMADAQIETIAFQALFQGLGPGFLAVILFTLSANHLGSTMTASFSACVPATAALLAIPVLGEIPTPLEWIGIATVSVGLAVLMYKPKTRPSL